MSVNLLDLAKGAIGIQMGQLACIFGESEQKTQSVVEIAIPTILGGLLEKSSTNEGADEIIQSLDDQAGGILQNLGGLLAGGNHTGLLNVGNGSLGMIFGSNQSPTIDSIAKIVGLDDSKIAAVLGLLAPIVMAVLGKQRRAQRLDVSGLAGLLAEQKDHLKRQLPAELCDTLGLGYSLDARVEPRNIDSADAARDAQSAVGSAVNDAESVNGDVTGTGKVGGGMLKTLLPLAILAALAFLGYQQMIERNAMPVGDVDLLSPDLSLDEIPVPNFNLPGFDSRTIRQTFDGLTNAINGIKDEASARRVLPEIEKAFTMMDGLDLGAIADGPQKEAVGGFFGGLIRKVRTAIEAAYGIPGVRGILEPAIAPFLERFSVFGL